MGYSTDFKGNFRLNKLLDDKTRKILEGLSITRRMKRDIVKLAKINMVSVDMAIDMWGKEGEFYFGDDIDSVIDYNYPPSCQPSLWFHWIYVERYGKGFLEWDGGEKFYNYALWLKYLIEEILAPAGYVLNGTITWEGESADDQGKLVIDENTLSVKPKTNLYNHYRYVMEPVMKPVSEKDFH